jgi:hypothetical protein
MSYLLGFSGHRLEEQQRVVTDEGTHEMHRRTGRTAAAAVIATIASTAFVSTASAGLVTASATSCDDPAVEQPFARWGDRADYKLVGDGGFEAGAKGWKRDDATVVAGNESYRVGGANDAASLKIPAGGSATSPTFCVGLEHPTARFFAKRVGGSLLSTLRVDVQFEDALGKTHYLPIGLVALNGGSWQPSLPMLLVANLLPLLPGQHTPVALRFVPQGGGAWQVDDVYVDPFRRF